MKTVLIFGTFDGLHPGHEYFLQEASKLGVNLKVVLARNKNIERLKGQLPKFSEEERKSALEKSALIDEVILGQEEMSYDIIKEIKPDIIALGYDQAVDEDKLRKIFKGKIQRLKAFKPEEYKSSKLNKKF